MNVLTSVNDWNHRRIQSMNQFVDARWLIGATWYAWLHQFGYTNKYTNIDYIDDWCTICMHCNPLIKDCNQSRLWFDEIFVLCRCKSVDNSALGVSLTPSVISSEGGSEGPVVGINTDSYIVLVWNYSHIFLHISNLCPIG